MVKFLKIFGIILSAIAFTLLGIFYPYQVAVPFNLGILITVIWQGRYISKLIKETQTNVRIIEEHKRSLQQIHANVLILEKSIRDLKLAGNDKGQLANQLKRNHSLWKKSHGTRD
jgi:hypothetical protein